MNIKELKNTLLSEYKYRVELHAHTCPCSGCSQITPKEMVETYKALNYHGVAITNHFVYQNGTSARDYVKNYLKDYEEALELGKKAGIKVYLGAEIRFTQNCNDYLVFGVGEDILVEIYDLLPMGVRYFRENYKMPKGVFLQAHPKRDNMEKIPAELLDGIEVFNLHPNHNSRVGVAAAYAGENGIKIRIAGSDFHHSGCGHEGLAAMLSRELPQDSFDIAKILKNGDYLLEIGRSNIVIP
ncbi:MAG: PHP domain-containing protein [Clostridiales bacterium]|nr:PHP domain-containing protein [Clostridiales bacterium]